MTWRSPTPLIGLLGVRLPRLVHLILAGTIELSFPPFWYLDAKGGEVG